MTGAWFKVSSERRERNQSRDPWIGLKDENVKKCISMGITVLIIVSCGDKLSVLKLQIHYRVAKKQNL